MQQLETAGVLLILAGILLVFLGFVASIISGDVKDSGNVKGGAVILIGPIPIVLGTDRNSTIIVLVLAIVLTILAYFFFLRR